MAMIDAATVGTVIDSGRTSDNPHGG